MVEISSNIAKGVKANLWGARDLGKAGLVPPRQGTGEDWVRISFLLNFEEKVRRTCIFVHFCAYICLIKPISGILSAFILSAMSSDLRKYHFANQVWLTDYGSISQIRKTVLYLKKKDLDVENDERHPNNFACSSLFWEDLDNKTKNNANSAFILINRMTSQGFQSG